jgi:hypothetical protein
MRYSVVGIDGAALPYILPVSVTGLFFLTINRYDSSGAKLLKTLLVVKKEN